jgi:hypothetical protein
MSVEASEDPLRAALNEALEQLAAAHAENTRLRAGGDNVAPAGVPSTDDVRASAEYAALYAENKRLRAALDKAVRAAAREMPGAKKETPSAEDDGRAAAAEAARPALAVFAGTPPRIVGGTCAECAPLHDALALYLQDRAAGVVADVAGVVSDLLARGGGDTGGAAYARAVRRNPTEMGVLHRSLAFLAALAAERRAAADDVVRMRRRLRAAGLE